jgi:dephospho-CoA kinase
MLSSRDSQSVFLSSVYMSNKERNVVVLGVTGGIACGKSETGRILGGMGFAVCDADRVAHELMKKGTPVYNKIVEHFGTTILSDNGEISRPLLGEIVFEHPGQRDVLNKLVHPAVRESLSGWIGQMRSKGQPAAVLIPLLFESGMRDLDWDAVLCVSSTETEIFQRMEKRGLSRDEAEKRIHSQMPSAEKEKRSDYVVPNHGTLGELELAVRKTVEAIVGER